jgi:hypothetical protein
LFFFSTFHFLLFLCFCIPECSYSSFLPPTPNYLFIFFQFQTILLSVFNSRLSHKLLVTLHLILVNTFSLNFILLLQHQTCLCPLFISSYSSINSSPITKLTC